MEFVDSGSFSYWTLCWSCCVNWTTTKFSSATIKCWFYVTLPFLLIAKCGDISVLVALFTHLLLCAHLSSQNSRALAISIRLILSISNDKVKDWKPCECRGYGVWEDPWISTRAQLWATSVKVSHFSFGLLLSSSSSGSEGQRKEKYSLNAKTIVNKHSLLFFLKSEMVNLIPCRKRKSKNFERITLLLVNQKGLGFGGFMRTLSYMARTHYTDLDCKKGGIVPT